MLEFYQAFADVHDMMGVTEELVVRRGARPPPAAWWST